MTTRIESNGPAPRITSTPIQPRTTAEPTRPFQQVMGAGASAVVAGAEATVRRLPGGPILAAAFRAPPPSAAPTVAHSAEGLPSPGGVGTPESPAGSDPASDQNLEAMLGENGDKNLYYIALQERISAENRMYTAYSNVLRARHETMKNAIGNFR